jgi:hypothetical protein
MDEAGLGDKNMDFLLGLDMLKVSVVTVIVCCQFLSADYLYLTDKTLLGTIPTELGHLGTLCKYYIHTAMSIDSYQGQHPHIPPVASRLSN